MIALFLSGFVCAISVGMFAIMLLKRDWWEAAWFLFAIMCEIGFAIERSRVLNARMDFARQIVEAAAKRAGGNAVGDQTEKRE